MFRRPIIRSRLGLAGTITALLLVGCGGSIGSSTTRSSGTTSSAPSQPATTTTTMSACVDAWNTTNNEWRYILQQAMTAGTTEAFVAQFADGKCGVAVDVPGQEGGDQGVYTAYVQASAGFTPVQIDAGAAGVAAAVTLAQQLVQQAGSQSNATINSNGSLAATPGATIAIVGVNSDGSAGPTATAQSSPPSSTTTATGLTP